MLKKLIKPNVKKLKSYSVPKIPYKVKLDANESPYDFALDKKILSSIKINRYPDPEAKELRKFLARKWNVKTGNILHGNGSDELIYYLIVAFGGPVLYPTPTFSMYAIISKAIGEDTIEIPLDKEFDLDIDKIIDSINKYKPKIIFLSTPNNPTGNSFSIDKMLIIIEESKGIVVIDEAYKPFSNSKSLIPLLSNYKNLVVMRSLSKIGLAALRLGFLVAHEEIIREVNKVRLPFNLNSLSQSYALNILKDNVKMNKHIDEIKKERLFLYNKLSNMSNVMPFPSDSNFILFRVKNAGNIYKMLTKDGILIRNVSDTIKDCLRVTVGKPSENREFIKCLKSILRDN